MTESDQKAKKEMLAVVGLLNKCKVPFNLLNQLRRKVAMEFVKLEDEGAGGSCRDDHDHSDNL